MSPPSAEHATAALPDLAAIAQVIIAASDDLDAIHARETALFDQAYRLGYHAGYAHGLVQGDREASDRWVGFAKLGQSLSHAEIVRRRNETDHNPCSRKCGNCSKCIHSKAWWARGGRDWLGVEAELRLSHVSRVDGAA